MKVPKEARARKGKPIPPAWIALQKWAETPEPHPGPGTRIREMPDETIIFTGRGGPTWPHPWRAAVTGSGIVVEPGFVNASMPRAGKENLTLDGLDEKDEPTGRRPEILLDSGPGRDGRSFICVRVVVDPATGEVTAETDPLKWLTVVHRSTLPVGFESGAMPEVIEDELSVGYFPVVLLYWTGDRVSRLFAAAHHHLQHRFREGAEKPGGGKKPNRHQFWV